MNNLLKDLFPFYEPDVAKDLLNEDELNTWQKGFEDPIFTRVLKTLFYEMSNLSDEDLFKAAPDLKTQSLIQPKALLRMMGDFICPSHSPFTEEEIQNLSEEELKVSTEAFKQAMTLTDKFNINGENKEKMMKVFHDLKSSQ